MSKHIECLLKPLRALLSILYPEQCRYCETPLGPINTQQVGPAHPSLFFCDTCWSSIKKLPSPQCPCCAIPFSSSYSLSESPTHLCGACRLSKPAFIKAFTPYCFEGVLTKAIHVLKYQQGRDLAPALAELLWSQTHDLKLDIITNIPLHISRLRQREFNQSALIALRLASRLNVPFTHNLITRTRDTPTQVGRSKSARAKNVLGAFSVKQQQKLQGKIILLVDDVYTTGATLNEAAKALMRAGAEQVMVAAPARMLPGVAIH